MPRGTGWMTRGLARRGTLCCIMITLPVVGGCRTLRLGACRCATGCSWSRSRLQHKIGTIRLRNRPIFLVSPPLLFSMFSQKQNPVKTRCSMQSLKNNLNSPWPPGQVSLKCYLPWELLFEWFTSSQQMTCLIPEKVLAQMENLLVLND